MRRKHSRAARIAYTWMSAVADPIRMARAAWGMPLFVRDYFRYRARPDAERLRFADMVPALHERTSSHELDAHYFYANAWAFRRIAGNPPALHVDVGSQVVLSSMLSAVMPVAFVDYRPLAVSLHGLETVAGDLVYLPFRGESVRSLSCLHVAEHVGLGRYGDPIDPAGTRKATAELSRVLAPGGNLFFAVPVGRERVAFNVHRIHAARTVRDYFSTLTLREFSGVDDRGRFFENAALDQFDGDEYGCGFYWFTK